MDREGEERVRGRGGVSGPHTELYALLHVPRDAAEEDISRAYRQMASVYHPDKFPSPQMQDVATANFQRIRAAYEILSDPARRQVYDIYGREGLEAGLELGPVLRTRDEIREQFERAEEARRQAHAAARTHHTSTLLVSVSAADFIASGMERMPQVMGMQMSTQIQAMLSPLDTAALGGSMISRRGISIGSLILMARRQITPEQSVEVVAAIGLRSLLTVSTTRQVSPSLKATSAAAIHLNEGVVSLTNTWAMNLSENSTGTIAWGLGPGAGLSVGWQKQLGEKTNVTSEVKVGEGFSVIGGSAVCTRKFSEKSSGRVSVRLGTSGADVEMGGSRKVSENSAAGFSVLVGLQGVMWKIRYTRAGQKFTMPILLSRKLHPRMVLSAFLLPSMSVVLLKLWQVSPWEKRRQKRKRQQKLMQTAEAVRAATADASSAQELMSAAAERKRRQQEASNGLIVTNALYGDPHDLQSVPSPAGHPHPSSAEGAVEGAAEGAAEGPSQSALLHKLAALVYKAAKELWRAAWEERDREAGEEEEGWRGGEGMPSAVWDVRIPLQFLVDESGALLLHRGVSKRGIMGFCDPCPNQPKQLKVWYTSQGRQHVVTVNDLDELRLPDLRHQL